MNKLPSPTNKMNKTDTGIDTDFKYRNCLFLANEWNILLLVKQGVGASNMLAIILGTMIKELRFEMVYLSLPPLIFFYKI